MKKILGALFLVAGGYFCPNPVRLTVLAFVLLLMGVALLVSE